VVVDLWRERIGFVRYQNLFGVGVLVTVFLMPAHLVFRLTTSTLGVVFAGILSAVVGVGVLWLFLYLCYLQERRKS
jgi:hypothetical protein